jgi:hypothetical protein
MTFMALPRAKRGAAYWTMVAGAQPRTFRVFCALMTTVPTSQLSLTANLTSISLWELDVLTVWVAPAIGAG